MKVSQVVNFKFLFSPRTLALLLSVGMFAVSISAQKTETPLAPEAIGVNIEQCANGPLAAPIACNIATANDGYTRGNLIASKSHYVEGDSVPIRIVADGLTVGSYTVTIGYDYTKGGQYANDYLTRYDRTESVSNDPCAGVSGCTLGSELTWNIPTDPEVTAGFNGVDDGAPGPTGGDDITQIPGQFSCFGCTITAVSGYTRSGLTTGDSTKSITLTFTANQSTIVIAYGSHISTRSDWGLANSAINISGSPYHNYVVDFPGANSGNRDLQLSAEAVIFPAFITIEKTVVGPTLQTTSTYQFGFTSSSALFPGTSFSLFDNVAEPFNVDPTQRVGGNINSLGITSFGSGNLITVAENALTMNWTLGALTCTSTGGINNNTINLGTRSVAIQLEEGEYVKCSFHNTQLTPSAAGASISGRVLTADGAGIRGAILTVTNVNTGVTRSAYSSTFGYYTFEDLPAADFYVVSITSKKFSFPNSTMSFTLNDSISDLDFIANP